MWIRWIRIGIRILNLLACLFAFHLTLGNSVELVAHRVSTICQCCPEEPGDEQGAGSSGQQHLQHHHQYEHLQQQQQ
jgi:hypothetical protein